MVNTTVLVLNRSFFPIHITSLKRAFCLLYQGFAQAVDAQFRTFDFDSWSQLSIEQRDETIGLVNRMIKVPRVILLLGYDRIPKGRVRFTRANIFFRDRNTCQYCGEIFPKSELSIDHVVPRSHEGTSTWENVVCSCFTCNKKKGGRTPKEASMRLISQPRRPRWTPFFRLTLEDLNRREWLPFLNIVDISYWNTELLEK